MVSHEKIVCGASVEAVPQALNLIISLYTALFVTYTEYDEGMGNGMMFLK
jgi:hypothetical protein